MQTTALCQRVLLFLLALAFPCGWAARAAADDATLPAAARQVDPRDWWSLRPLSRPELPPLHADAAAWTRNPIDWFVRARLDANGLAPAPEAGRRTLVRRLYYDLTGLPPTPKAVEDFVRNPDPRAYEALVEDLLASPHYGERWARHWLDVVHYGDTHGYDKDKLRPNAWPYRDYVIRAFNNDKPYGRFVQEQLAGDVLFPGTADGIEALGFISAGPWDFIGHAEVPETKIDGRIARHLDRDDMVANTMNTFNSFTVQCAQCHRHKFDPISQEDYYSLQAVFAALDRTDRTYDRDPDVGHRRRQLANEHRALEQRREVLVAMVSEKGGEPLASLEEQIRKAQQATEKTDRPEYGYHSQIETDPGVVKWVQVDLGLQTDIRRIAYAPCSDSFNNIGDGFGFPVRFKIDVSSQPDFSDPNRVTPVVDCTASDMPNPGIIPQSVEVDGAHGRYVRVTATKLSPRQNDYIFALSELEVFDASGTNVARDATVTSLDSIEAPVRWRRSNLVDGIYPGVGMDVQATGLADLQAQRQALIERTTPPEVRLELAEVDAAMQRIEKEQGTLPPQAMVYAGAVHDGNGAFRGTGPDGGTPRPIHLLYRGDVQNEGPLMEPSALSVMSNLAGSFDLKPGHPEGQRRAALARWLTDREHPLTWRSIVNRAWLYHFNQGIVDSPNDFGRMGQLPSHPELFDWLAVEFRDGGQSIKQLHRLILTSATYRQASTVAPGPMLARAEEVDANNRLLWKMTRRRLEAEAVRDSVLQVSGKLDRRMYGPGFQDFVIEKPEHSPHYQYHLYDPEDPTSHRRSIYRFIVRSQPQPFMSTLDCADPSMLVGKRNESLSALQALALLNNAFMLTMSRHFAERIEQTPGDLDTRIDLAFYEALGREPSPEEHARLVAYGRENGLVNTCRLLFNLNEFVFVD